jgi:hypothetical protein
MAARFITECARRAGLLYHLKKDNYGFGWPIFVIACVVRGGQPSLDEWGKETYG